MAVQLIKIAVVGRIILKANQRGEENLVQGNGRTHLEYAQVEAVVMDIERQLNNRPLTYMESETGEEKVLTPN